MSLFFLFFTRIICGLTRHTKKSHIAFATMEAVCFQTGEVRCHLPDLNQKHGIFSDSCTYSYKSALNIFSAGCHIYIYISSEITVIVSLGEVDKLRRRQGWIMIILLRAGGSGEKTTSGGSYLGSHQTPRNCRPSHTDNSVTRKVANRP